MSRRSVIAVDFPARLVGRLFAAELSAHRQSRTACPPTPAQRTTRDPQSSKVRGSLTDFLIPYSVFLFPCTTLLGPPSCKEPLRPLSKHFTLLQQCRSSIVHPFCKMPCDCLHVQSIYHFARVIAEARNPRLDVYLPSRHVNGNMLVECSDDDQVDRRWPSRLNAPP